MLDWRSHWGSSHPGYRRASDWWTLSQTDSRRQPIAAKTEERTRRWGSTATRARLKQERLRFPKRRTSCSFPLEYSPEKAWREAPLSEPATPPSWCVGRRYDSMAQPRTKRNEQMEYACSASIDKHWVVRAELVRLITDIQLHILTCTSAASPAPAPRRDEAFLFSNCKKGRNKNKKTITRQTNRRGKKQPLDTFFRRSRASCVRYGGRLSLHFRILSIVFFRFSPVKGGCSKTWSWGYSTVANADSYL